MKEDLSYLESPELVECEHCALSVGYMCASCFSALLETLNKLKKIQWEIWDSMPNKLIDEIWKEAQKELLIEIEDKLDKINSENGSKTGYCIYCNTMSYVYFFSVKERFHDYDRDNYIYIEKWI
jgi:hypothetical protein